LQFLLKIYAFIYFKNMSESERTALNYITFVCRICIVHLSYITFVCRIFPTDNVKEVYHHWMFIIFGILAMNSILITAAVSGVISTRQRWGQIYYYCIIISVQCMRNEPVTIGHSLRRPLRDQGLQNITSGHDISSNFRFVTGVFFFVCL
jgi:hypothetical protein